ncbi:MAG: glycosyltransferase family 4 protein [Hydrogenophilales bacterium]
MKKVLVHDYAGHPFQIDLSRELAKKFNVLHCYNGSNTTPQGKTLKNKNDLSSFDIQPITLKNKISKYSFFKRWTQEISYGFKLLSLIKRYKPDTIISGNTPLDAQLIIFIYSKIKGIKFIFWLQDMIAFTAGAIIKRKIRLLGILIESYFGFLEKNFARFSDYTIITMDSHIDILKSWGVKESKIVLNYNWAPLDDYPVVEKKNNWSVKNNYDDKFVFMWTGTMGMKHNPDLIFELSKKFINNEKVKIVVVSQSIGADWLSNKKETHNLHNLDILPYQDFQDVPNMMGASDCLICIVGNDVSDGAIPSKFLSYMCAKRGILLAIKEDNQAALIANEYNTALVCNPDDINHFLENADIIYNNSSLRNLQSINARQYASDTFQIELIVKNFEKII